ncbi:Kef-type K+ transport system membrane component KefB/Trk K+ transport system NAD-binding subunit [Symbiobacterium terraclitae]|uniref:Kef-type K+ transport system membrane component KefB/Trk K+ transport system NAD-binding subunit n=1 Tax=Symbiobacterium terraclitae TaxID=557451 RepID=A0ABS4JVC8_9FIRM|nr:monovalent cation:proton antiporter family protein [Symbiobacterium terraclitae]MBP2019464.1 Kef-type K+ transport system membrane component KefB/Trk K+ transport system NAD-binding subunit [Symbiobacterium terraclitae]
MPNHGPALGSLVLVAVLAFVVPLLLNRLRRVRVPIAAGEILAGMLVGKSGLGLVHSDELLSIFNFLGIGALMFLAGMEIDLAALVGGGARPKGRPAWLARLHQPLALGAALFLLTAYGAWWFAHRLHARGLVEEPLFLTLIVATCGLSIIMPVLKERNMFADPFGQVLFSTAVIADFLPMLGLSVLAAVRLNGSALEALWILALLGFGVLVYLAARWLQRFKLLEGLTGGTAQISVRAAWALMLVFLALAQTVGVEAILGSFLAGLLLSMLAGSHREEISHKLDALGFGFLIPIFFVMVGVEFDLRALLSDPAALALVPLLLGGTILVKALPGVLLAIWHPLRRTLAGMALLTTQMSVTIAASAVAYTVGAYGASTHAAVVLVAIVTAILGPILFNRILGDAGPEPERTGVVLAGMNRLSLHLGRRLLAHGVPVSAVDEHPERVQEFAGAGISAVLSHPSAEEGLRQAGAERARALVALTGDERSNLAAARLGRSQFGIPRAILFATSPECLAEAAQEGLEAVNPDLSPALLVESLLTSPGATALLTGEDRDVQIQDFTLTGGPLVGTALRDARLPAGVLVVSVLRGAEKIVPHGNTVLQQGDLLTVVGPPESWEAMRRLAAGQSV